MSANKSGKCHLCGEVKVLTYEHIPPKSAFNKSSELLTYKFNNQTRMWEPSKNNPYGVGDYTLCAKCNNETGGTYGQAFCDFISKIADGPAIAKEYRVPVKFVYKGFLQRILKQVLTLFCSTNGPDFCDKHPTLRSYLLDPGFEKFPENIFIYIYLVNRTSKISSGLQGILNLRTNTTTVCSEILFWPLGYILSFEKLEENDLQGATILDITNWKNFPINKRIQLELTIYKNYRLLMFPLDFRSKEEIEKESGKPIDPPGLFPFIDYEI